jgi:hypothetical protein
MEWLLLNGPLFASGLPGEFALHVRIETLQHGKAVWIVVVKPEGTVDPIRIVAGMHGAKLHVKVPDDVGVSFARFERFAGLHAISNGIDHAPTKVSVLIENDNFRMLIVVEKPGGIGPLIACVSSTGYNTHYVPALLVDDLEKLLVEFGVAFTRFGINWHASGRVSEKCSDGRPALSPVARRPYFTGFCEEREQRFPCSQFSRSRVHS